MKVNYIKKNIIYKEFFLHLIKFCFLIIDCIFDIIRDTYILWDLKMTKLKLIEIQETFESLQELIKEITDKDKNNNFVSIKVPLFPFYKNIEKIYTKEGFKIFKNNVDCLKNIYKLSKLAKSDELFYFVLGELKTFNFFRDIEKHLLWNSKKINSQDIHELERLITLNNRCQLYSPFEMSIIKIILTDDSSRYLKDESSLSHLKEITTNLGKRDASETIEAIVRHLSEINFFLNFNNIELFYNFKKDLMCLGEKSNEYLDIIFKEILKSNKESDVFKAINKLTEGI